ncbi:MAG: peptidyl-prolyl cis-trans isomerase [Candidatus Omnitrophota bacterium]|nr:MAG: peptidyl-prolyl cis-trans isomerase [Candidatus Omnitrophota bacterium]
MMKIKLLVPMMAVMTIVVTASVFSESKEEEAAKDLIIATIGKEKIYFSELERESEKLNRFLKENFQTSKTWRLDFFRKYIATLALAKRAKRQGLDREADVIHEIERARRGILAEKLVADEFTKLKISEEDLRKYYEQNKEKYRIKEKVKLSYVKSKSKKEADRIVHQLNKGRNFEKVGGRNITRIDSWISKDAPFAPELEEILSSQVLDKIFQLNKGEVTDVLKIKDEFYVFHINEKEPAQDKPFKQVRQQVEFEYTRRQRDRIINELITQTFSQEKVELYEDKVIRNIEVQSR